jgi:hypothetical protein
MQLEVVWWLTGRHLARWLPTTLFVRKSLEKGWLKISKGRILCVSSGNHDMGAATIVIAIELPAGAYMAVAGS